MKSDTAKQLLIVAGVAFGALALWEIFSAVRAGERAIGNILMAPFNGLASAWKAVTGLFSFGSDSSGPESSLVAPSSPLYGLTLPGGQAIDTIGTALLSPAPPSAFDWSNYNP